MASSSTSSRASRNSSTSDGLTARVAGLIRLVHPFPSLLDGLVVVGVAIVAGADLLAAIRLGLSMTALQMSIGSLNDLVDAPADAEHKPGKPIPNGRVSRPLARAVTIVSAGVGIGLAIPSGPTVVALAVVVLTIGYAYDLVAKGTAWSWLPFAVGIPLLPVYGWVGAAGTVPDWFVALAPMAAAAGAALAVANALADVERDRAAGTATVATALGSRARWVGAGAWGVAATIAVGSLVAVDVGLVALGTTALGIAVVTAGIVLGWRGDPARRELAWEVQAVGAGVTAVAWVVAVS
jgi:4-hydroxybenzoate polyprenyltransferase